MDTSILDIDKNQIPPIQKKRILAFVNHFLIETSTFLNKFANECETKFLEVERKIQTVEAALVIVEAKLNSIPGIDSPPRPKAATIPPPPEPLAKDSVDCKTDDAIHIEEPTEKKEEPVVGVKASEDQRYKKYFKMLQFGVPPSGVKQKMSAEGFDPNILE